MSQVVRKSFLLKGEMERGSMRSFLEVVSVASDTPLFFYITSSASIPRTRAKVLPL